MTCQTMRYAAVLLLTVCVVCPGTAAEPTAAPSARMRPDRSPSLEAAAVEVARDVAEAMSAQGAQDAKVTAFEELASGVVKAFAAALGEKGIHVSMQWAWVAMHLPRRKETCCVVLITQEGDSSRGTFRAAVSGPVSMRAEQAYVCKPWVVAADRAVGANGAAVLMSMPPKGLARKLRQEPYGSRRRKRDREGHGERDRDDQGERDRKGHGERDRKGHGERDRDDHGERDRDDHGERDRKGHGERDRKGHGEQDREGHRQRTSSWSGMLRHPDERDQRVRVRVDDGVAPIGDLEGPKEAVQCVGRSDLCATEAEARAEADTRLVLGLDEAVSTWLSPNLDALSRDVLRLLSPADTDTFTQSFSRPYGAMFRTYRMARLRPALLHQIAQRTRGVWLARRCLAGFKVGGMVGLTLLIAVAYELAKRQLGRRWTPALSLAGTLGWLALAWTLMFVF